MSYLLRHNPENLNMDKEGFVDLADLVRKLRERYPVDKHLIHEIVGGPGNRFEVVNNKIRARYGHTLDVDIPRIEDTSIEALYHGTTAASAACILREGLKPMNRQWVHLSPTPEIARSVGWRRTAKPVVVKVNAQAARTDGIKFYRATGTVFLCSAVPARYVTIIR